MSVGVCDCCYPYIANGNYIVDVCVCREHAVGATNDYGHSFSVSFLRCLSCEGACQQVQACSGAFAAPHSVFSTTGLFQSINVHFAT